MSRRPWSLKATLALAIVNILLLATIGAAQVIAHSATPTHYSGTCLSLDTDSTIIGRHTASGNFNPNELWYTGTGALTGVRANYLHQNLDPCSDGSASLASGTYILITLQGHGGNANEELIQIGVMQTDISSGTLCCGLLDNTAVFAYTRDGDGVMHRATWVDHNNNGVADNPQVGHTYLISVEETNDGLTGGNTWTYCVTDMSAAGDPFDCKWETRGSSDGGLNDSNENPAAWWGCEVDNRANRLGVQYGSAGAKLSELGYEKAGQNNTWYYTTQSTAYNGHGTSIPYYYHPGQNQDGLGEQMNCYTTLH